MEGSIVDAASRPGPSRSRRKSAGSGRFARRPTVPREPPPGGLYGALDLGTNNCRLLIATPASQGFVVVDAFSRIVRLGERLGQTGRLSDEAMARTIEALRVCANKLRWRKVEKVRLVATEACRLAANGPAFIVRVREETGLSLEIIDRETEAGLAAVGAEPLVDRAAETALVFDIGGGSTEMLWMRRAGERFETVAWTSLSAGVVTISEQFGGGVDVTPASFAAMRAHLRPMLQDFARRVSELTGQSQPVPSHLLGTSGTVTTIAGVQLGLARYDRSRVDGCWLDSAQTGVVTQRLLDLTYDQRAANPCIGRERADLVLAGCAILEEIRLAFPAGRIRVADRGLREGILTMMMKQDGAYGRSP
ncbi:Ppx/GppA phosphatase family protein [Aestuariivirga sp.]|jgi:exopolyphosphatase/guanosine-5'-triphosphate,3'-diphosphate pyrophosphatase|uniref:Ppx/GppA phosphatase family protein n=1 Tax=Aestuariivirga sp. TaxID=2650926 RepID=UPI003784E4FD